MLKRSNNPTDANKGYSNIHLKWTNAACKSKFTQMQLISRNNTSHLQCMNQQFPPHQRSSTHLCKLTVLEMPVVYKKSPSICKASYYSTIEKQRAVTAIKTRASERVKVNQFDFSLIQGHEPNHIITRGAQFKKNINFQKYHWEREKRTRPKQKANKNCKEDKYFIIPQNLFTNAATTSESNKLNDSNSEHELDNNEILKEYRNNVR